jgi:signal transduction histidine kinase
VSRSQEAAIANEEDVLPAGPEPGSADERTPPSHWPARTQADRGRLITVAVARHLDQRLKAVLAYAELIEEGMLTGSGRRSAARSVRKIADELISLTARLLAFAAHGAESQPARCELNRELTACLSALGPCIPGTIDVSVSLLASPLPVALPPDELGLLVTELVLNAVEAVRGMGALRVDVRAEGDVALLEIADSGPAIAPDTCARVFEPFFTTRTADEHRGVGLAVVGEIARRRGVGVEVDSDREIGTTVRVRLPLCRD